MGLQGMINDLLQKADFPTGKDIIVDISKIEKQDKHHLAQLISAAENYPKQYKTQIKKLEEHCQNLSTPIIGITGTGGSGKSSLVDELVRRFLIDFKQKTIAIISVDPSKRKTDGALFGDRIRMNSINNPRVYMRSLATRQANLALSRYVHDALCLVKNAHFDLIILETSGIGQSDTEITEQCNLSLYVMTPEYGAATQLEKIDMLDFADFIAINKFDKRGALDALRDVKKQYALNHHLWETKIGDLPVFGTIASTFHDPGIIELYHALMCKLNELIPGKFASKIKEDKTPQEKNQIIPSSRVRYLSEISETIRNYNQWIIDQGKIAKRQSV